MLLLSSNAGDVEICGETRVIGTIYFKRNVPMERTFAYGIAIVPRNKNQGGL